MDETCFDPATKRPRVLSRQCETCIFRPGNPMHLKPGRLKSMVNAALQQGTQGVICHDTLSYGAHPDFGGAMCRGFYDKYGPLNNFVRIMERLGGFTEVDPPAAEAPDDEKRCPNCGSIDICQDWLVRNRGKHGWTCDRCEHEWDIDQIEALAEIVKTWGD